MPLLVSGLLFSRTPEAGLRARFGGPSAHGVLNLSAVSLRGRSGWGSGVRGVSRCTDISGLDARWAAGALALGLLLESSDLEFFRFWESAPGWGNG